MSAAPTSRNPCRATQAHHVLHSGSARAASRVGAALTSLVMAALVTVVLAGCASDATPTAIGIDILPTPTAADTTATVAPVVTEPTATAASVAPAVTEGATPDPAATPAPSPEPTPAASDDGFPGWLRVNGFGPVDFGSDLAAAQALIAPRFGAPDEIVDNPDCGLTIAAWGDFSIAFEAGEFVGWFYHSSEPALESPSGVAPGISTADLRAIYQGVDISETTLGTEFFFEVPAGFIGGFFTPDGQLVTDMYAGHNCFFR